MEIVFKNKVFRSMYLSLIIAGLISAAVSCSYDRGIIVTGEGNEKSGYILFSECIDSYAGEKKQAIIKFKKTKISSWENVNISDIIRIEKENETFIFIDSKRISGEQNVNLIIPAGRILSGKLSVFRYCTARYNSTMLSSNRMDINIYLLSEKGKDIFYTIPQDPERFKIFSAEHFSTCPGLVKEIKNMKFIKKIENPIPGNITDYELVEEKDITGFVDSFNKCEVSP